MEGIASCHSIGESLGSWETDGCCKAVVDNDILVFRSGRPVVADDEFVKARIWDIHAHGHLVAGIIKAGHVTRSRIACAGRGDIDSR